MTDEQLTAIAREYAEWICPYKDKSANLSILDIREAERLINFLLRRFCLVEKENIEKYFQSRNYILTHQDVYEVYIVRESEVEMKLLRCLFPEIAKEVENEAS